MNKLFCFFTYYAYGHENIGLNIMYDSFHHLATLIMAVRVNACSAVTKRILTKPCRVRHAVFMLLIVQKIQ